MAVIAGKMDGNNGSKRNLIQLRKFYTVNDSVTIGLRREESSVIFSWRIPEVTVLDSPGNYDLYRSYLEGAVPLCRKDGSGHGESFFYKKAAER